MSTSTFPPAGHSCGCYHCQGGKQLPPLDSVRLDERHIGIRFPQPFPGRYPDYMARVFLDGVELHDAVEAYAGTRGEGWVVRIHVPHPHVCSCQDHTTSAGHAFDTITPPDHQEYCCYLQHGSVRVELPPPVTL